MIDGLSQTWIIVAATLVLVLCLIFGTILMQRVLISQLHHNLAKAKEQTERYCVPEIAVELENEGYMIDKPYPFDSEFFNFNQAILEDESDEDAPDEWVEKMFPEIDIARNPIKRL